MNFFIMQKIKIPFYSESAFERTIPINKYSRKFFDIYLEKRTRNTVFFFKLFKA